MKDETRQKLNQLKSNIKEVASKVKNKVFDLGDRLLNLAIDNPEATAAIAVPIVVSGIRSGQSLIVNHRIKQQEARADRTWYDRSTGLRWDLRRKMTNNDRKAITEMKAQGMDSIDILSRLNLI